MDTKRVGIVGIENSHAEEIIRYLNVAQPEHIPSHRRAGCRRG